MLFIILFSSLNFIYLYFRNIKNYLYLNFEIMLFNLNICFKILKYKIVLLKIFRIIIINIYISLYLFVLNYFFYLKKNLYHKIFIISIISLVLFTFFF